MIFFNPPKSYMFKPKLILTALIFFCTLFFSMQNYGKTQSEEKIIVQGHTKHILFLGDSLTEGEGLDEVHAFPKLVENKFLKKNMNVQITNGGVSGSTSASGLKRLQWHLKSKVDYLVLELGANDGLRGLKVNETQKNLESIISFAVEKNIKVILLGVLMPPNYGKNYTESFSAMYKTMAKKFQLPFMPFVLEGVAGNPKLNLADGIHPNIEGHKIIAENVFKFLERVL